MNQLSVDLLEIIQRFAGFYGKTNLCTCSKYLNAQSKNQRIINKMASDVKLNNHHFEKYYKYTNQKCIKKLIKEITYPEKFKIEYYDGDNKYFRCAYDKIKRRIKLYLIRDALEHLIYTGNTYCQTTHISSSWDNKIFISGFRNDSNDPGY